MFRSFRVLSALLLACTLTSSAAFAADTASQERSGRTMRPAAPRLSVSAEAKTLKFRWTSVSGASHYILLRNPGTSGYVSVGGPIAANRTHKTVGVAVHLLDWENATYLLTACNKAGCTNSNIVGVADLANRAIDLIPSPDEGTTPIGDPIVRRFSAGMALSADGKTLAVSDHDYFARVGADFVLYAGAVFVYRRSGGSWNLDAKLQQPSPSFGDQFGSALSITADGQTLAIGADQDGTPGMGSVHIFTRTGSAWMHRAQLSPSRQEPLPGQEEEGALFGAALELSAAGDVLAVGAPFETVTGEAGAIARAGAVYVFRCPTRMWQLHARLTAPSAQQDDRFGAAVTLSGNGRRVIVLAGEQNSSTAIEGGDGFGGRLNTLHAFVTDGPGWRQEAAIEAPSGTQFFGGSAWNRPEIVAYRALDTDWHGNVLAVGVGLLFAPHPGEIRIYRRNRDSWSLADTLAPSLSGRESFAKVLALSTNGRVLAAQAVQTEYPYPKPSVVVFKRSQGTWVEQSVLDSHAWPNYDNFGLSLALSHSGTTLAVGAGHVYIY